MMSFCLFPCGVFLLKKKITIANIPLFIRDKLLVRELLQENCSPDQKNAVG